MDCRKGDFCVVEENTVSLHKITDMKQFWSRLKSDVPVFFRWIQAIGGSMAGTALALSQLKGVPASIASHCETIIWVGGAIAIVAQFPTKTTVETKPIEVAK